MARLDAWQESARTSAGITPICVAARRLVSCRHIVAMISLPFSITCACGRAGEGGRGVAGDRLRQKMPHALRPSRACECLSADDRMTRHPRAAPAVHYHRHHNVCRKHTRARTHPHTHTSRHQRMRAHTHAHTHTHEQAPTDARTPSTIPTTNEERIPSLDFLAKSRCIDSPPIKSSLPPLHTFYLHPCRQA